MIHFSLHAQVVTMKGGGDSTKYKHNQQLEELRNLQDKLTAEKGAWSVARDQEAKELEEKKSELLQLQVRFIYDNFIIQLTLPDLFCRSKLRLNNWI